mgnify:CR=1 FL=1
MKRKPAELDVVEVTADLPCGIIEGARGTIVDVRSDEYTVEFLDHDGYTIGLFEIPASDLEVVVPYVSQAMGAREE